MKKIALYTYIIVSILGLSLSTAHVAYTEDERLFPTNKEEIRSIFEQEPLSLPVPQASGKGALPSSGDGSVLFDKQQGTSRGIDAIVDYEYEKLAEEAPIAAALVLFDYNSAEIKEESFLLLRGYGELLQDEFPDIVLIVAGHTDDKGSDEYNLMLSQRRAESVRNFLITEFDIAQERLIVKPYGESNPIDTNTTAEGRQKNRRVEFIRIR